MSGWRVDERIQGFWHIVRGARSVFFEALLEMVDKPEQLIVLPRTGQADDDVLSFIHRETNPIVTSVHRNGVDVSPLDAFTTELNGALV